MIRDSFGRIVKGSTLTAEERAKKAVSLSLSWKNRPDYIGDIKEECPRVFNSWRSIRDTKKGRSAGCCEEWFSFRNFYNDVRPSYSDGLVLRRKNTALPWGPDNFMWVTPEVAGAINARIFIEYNGESLSIQQWGDKLQIRCNTIKTRYYKHPELGPEYWLFGRRKNRGSKKAKDKDEVASVRAKASKMISSYRNKDIANGTEVCDISIEWMIDNILSKPCVYCGDTKRVGCDRIDNNVGHIKSNVVPCCIECNTARNNYFTYEEMRELGKAIAKIKNERKNNEKERTLFRQREPR